MTAAVASDQNRAEQLESLRRQIAVLSGKVPEAVVTRSDDLLPESESQLPVPQWLADALPAPLPRGTVAMLSGARSLLLSMVAAVTAAGGNAAIVGQPDIGLLAAVLIDGMDLVVLGLGGRRVPLTRARAVVARARLKGCTLLVTDGDWQGAPTRLEARVCGYDITAGNRGTPVCGFGRISGVRLQVSGVCAGRRVLGRARTG